MLESKGTLAMISSEKVRKRESSMKKRESFNSRWGFILACIGSAVGMGNIWMFPTRVSLYGGGSFLIPYFLFVALIGFTGVSGEMSFGRATRSGPVDAFGFACETKGKRKAGEALGLIPVLGSLAMAIGYTVVMGWIFRYMIGTFTGKTLSAVSVEDFAGAFESMASAFGNNFWQIVALVVAMVILAFGVGKGIEKVNKVLMPVFFLLFVALGIYVAFQPGSKTYGILSVLLQAWYDVEYLFTVSEKVFDPPPKVKSAVLKMTRNDRKELGCDEKLFKTVVKTSFNQRRKTLRNSMKPLLGKDCPDYALPIFDKRPEQLSVEQFVELTLISQKHLEKQAGDVL